MLVSHGVPRQLDSPHRQRHRRAVVTAAPLAAKVSAITRPAPEPAAVTIARWPSSERCIAPPCTQGRRPIHATRFTSPGLDLTESQYMISDHIRKKYVSEPWRPPSIGFPAAIPAPAGGGRARNRDRLRHCNERHSGVCDGAVDGCLQGLEIMQRGKGVLPEFAPVDKETVHARVYLELRTALMTGAFAPGQSVTIRSRWSRQDPGSPAPLR